MGLIAGSILKPLSIITRNQPSLGNFIPTQILELFTIFAL